jgi:hypothetical protein
MGNISASKELRNEIKKVNPNWDEYWKRLD